MAPYTVTLSADRKSVDFVLAPGAQPTTEEAALKVAIETACQTLAQSGLDDARLAAKVAKIFPLAVEALGSDPPKKTPSQSQTELAAILAPAAIVPANGFFLVSARGTDEIAFQSLGTEPPPEDMARLKADVEVTLGVLQSLFPVDNNNSRGPKFAGYLAALLGLAQVGMSGSVFNTPVGAAALDSLKQRVMALEGSTIKNGTLKRLGAEVLGLGLTSLLVGGAFYLLAKGVWSLPATVPLARAVSWDLLSGMCLMWAGSMAGVWISFAARANTVTFEELANPDGGQLEPRIRLLFAGALTVAFGLLFHFGAVTVDVGSLKSSEIATNGNIALLLGFAAGFNERLLSSAIVSRTAGFFK